MRDHLGIPPQRFDLRLVGPVALALAVSLSPACNGDDAKDATQKPPLIETGDTPAVEAGEGLLIEIVDLSSGSEGTVDVEVDITDASGSPIDALGLLEDGTLELGFVVSRLEENAPGDPLQYTPFTLSSESGLPDWEWNGSLEATETDGRFRYALTDAIDVGGDVDALTHTVAVLGVRDHEGVEYVANARDDFRPDGERVQTTREVVTLDGCDTCHRGLRVHEDKTQRATADCVLCHTAGVEDPITGNSMDLKVMVHRIHTGMNLPSVVDGARYQLGREDGTLADFTTVEFPRDILLCDTCHNGAHAHFSEERTTRAACGSCHDQLAFETPLPEGFTLHDPQLSDDSTCNDCHVDGLGNNAAAHRSRLLDEPILEIEMNGMIRTGPGENPIIEFTAYAGGEPLDILAEAEELTIPASGPQPIHGESGGKVEMTFAMSGPTVEIDNDTWSTLPYPERLLYPVTDGSDGRFRYDFKGWTVPEDAEGSWAVGGHMSIKLPNGLTAHTDRNPVLSFAVTDEEPVARRQIVSTEKCNACHYDLRQHETPAYEGFTGNAFNSVEFCVNCHHPQATTNRHMPHFEQGTVVAPTSDFKVIMHAAHRGVDRKTPYVVGTHPMPIPSDPLGTPVHFEENRIPADLRDCEMCHLPGTYQLPLPETRAASMYWEMACEEEPAADDDEMCTPELLLPIRTWSVLPTRSVCTACHDGESTQSHAEDMTDGETELCAECHGPGEVEDIARHHVVDP